MSDSTGPSTPDSSTTPAPTTPAGHLGVLATWRATSRPARAVLAGVFVNRLASFLQIFLVLFLTQRGYSSGQAGLALGVYGAGVLVGTLAGGWLSDRLSARTAILVSMLGSALLILSIVYLDNYPVILVAVLLVSAFGQLYRPAAQAVLTELTPPHQLIMVTAMYRLSFNLGTTAAPLIGVALASVSYNLLFWGEAIAALVYALIAFTALPVGAEPATPAVKDDTKRPSRAGYLALLNDPRFLGFLTAFLLLCIVYSQYTAALPLAIVGSGLSTWWYGAVVALNALIVVTCEVVATKWVQTWPLRLTQMSAFGLLAVGYGIYAIDIAPVFLILGTLVWTASEIIGAPTVYAYPGMVAPAALRGRYFGALYAMFGLGSTLGPILGITLFNHVGARVFLWAALVGVIALIIGRIGMRGPSESPAESLPPSESPDPATGPAIAEPAS